MSSGSSEEDAEEGREPVAAAQAPPVPPEKDDTGETKPSKTLVGHLRASIIVVK